MYKTLITQITDCIERIFDMGVCGLRQGIIVFPCGDVGIQTISIMRNIYSLEPAYLIDNKKCRYSSHIHELSYLDGINTEEYILFLASTNWDIYDEIKGEVLKYFSKERIIELECMTIPRKERLDIKPTCGKYSYGPLCTNPYVESIGAFCSFAEGTSVVENHATDYISTHPFVYYSGNSLFDGWNRIKYEDYSDAPWYFPGVNPHAEKLKMRRTRIGNDVWLGRNVIITNGAYVGNGVIAGAGAVITKDIPDYAVVVGAPARIIKYRYYPDQIESLNKIAWWNWSDDEIRDRFDDLYLPIEEFIKKYA